MASAVEHFEAIRPEVVARVFDGRATLKLGFAAQAPDVARTQLDAVLDRIAGFLVDRDPERYRGFIARWVAYHLGEGFDPEDMVHSVVTLGDLVCQVARGRLPAGDETAGFVRDVTRTTHAMVRLVVDVIGEELGRFDLASRRTVIP
jgi:hypothetical protein